MVKFRSSVDFTMGKVQLPNHKRSNARMLWISFGVYCLLVIGRCYIIYTDRPCYRRVDHTHDDVIKWKHFLRYWPLWGESTGHRWIPPKKASDAKLSCFLWSTPEQKGWANNVDPMGFKTTSRSLWRHCIADNISSYHWIELFQQSQYNVHWKGRKCHILCKIHR